MITAYHTTQNPFKQTVFAVAHTIEDMNFAVQQFLKARTSLFRDVPGNGLLLDGFDELTGETIFEEL